VKLILFKYLIFSAIYVVSNITAIKLQLIPGFFTWLLWGFVFPVIAIIGTWLYFFKVSSFPDFKYRVSAFGSLFFLLSGLFNIYVIAAMWASI